MNIYIVICRQVNNPRQYQVSEILEVISTTLDDAISGKHDYHTNYALQGIMVNVYFFLREIDNPFKGFTTVEK